MLEELYLIWLALMKRKKRPWLDSSTYTRTIIYVLIDYYVIVLIVQLIVEQEPFPDTHVLSLWR